MASRAKNTETDIAFPKAVERGIGRVQRNDKSGVGSRSRDPRLRLAHVQRDGALDFGDAMILAAASDSERVFARRKRRNLHEYGHSDTWCRDGGVGAATQPNLVVVERMIADDAKTRSFGGKPFAIALAVPCAGDESCRSDADRSRHCQPEVIQDFEVMRRKRRWNRQNR